MPTAVDIILKDDRAFLCSSGRIVESGLNICLDPVHVVPLDPTAIAKAVILIRDSPITPLTETSLQEIREKVWKGKDPILKATRTSSWFKLAASAASYVILWGDQSMEVSPSILDKAGHWVDDWRRQKDYSLDTPIETIVQHILDDYRYQLEHGFRREPAGRSPLPQGRDYTALRSGVVRLERDKLPYLPPDQEGPLAEALSALRIKSWGVSGYLRKVAYQVPEWRDIRGHERFLTIDDTLTAQIEAAPDDPRNPIKAKLLAHKALMDDLIRLAQGILEHEEHEPQ